MILTTPQRLVAGIDEMAEEDLLGQRERAIQSLAGYGHALAQPRVGGADSVQHVGFVHRVASRLHACRRRFGGAKRASVRGAAPAPLFVLHH